VRAWCGRCGGGKHLLRNPIIHRGFDLDLIAFHHAQVVPLLRPHHARRFCAQQPGIERHAVVVERHVTQERQERGQFVTAWLYLPLVHNAAEIVTGQRHQPDTGHVGPSTAAQYLAIGTKPAHGVAQPIMQPVTYDVIYYVRIKRAEQVPDRGERREVRAAEAQRPPYLIPLLAAP
jgi:hypothetical protein